MSAMDIKFAATREASRADFGRAARRRPIIPRLSVRRSVQGAMLVLVLLDTVQAALNFQAVSRAAFLLQRAETSNRQLDDYRGLSIGALEWLVLARTGPGASEAALRAVVEAKLQNLQRSTTVEVALVRANGGDEGDVMERRRIEQLEVTVGEMFAGGIAADHRESTVETYRARLKPLLDRAIDNEWDEVLAVEREMEMLKSRMSWLSSVGILLETLTVGLVLSLIVGKVLDPVRRLVADIGEFRRGRLAHRVLVTRRDEFGVLALHINRMARQLERGRQNLVAINDGLEKIVAERTLALRERNEELREIDESRRRFFIDVSHELRTPLTAIVGEADVTLRDGRADVETCRDALRSILANSTYLNRRIDDLMALARSIDGQLGIDREVLDLNAIASDAMAEIQSLAKINQVTTHFEPLRHPLLVDGDRFRIRQCLMILLDNAVKFSRESQPVEVILAEADRNANMTVRNRGSAIEEHDLPAIFERFYQTEVGRRKGGTGLGLAIARRIVDAHSGTITATSEPSGKTAITISLPLAGGLPA